MLDHLTGEGNSLVDLTEALNLELSAKIAGVATGAPVDRQAVVTALSDLYRILRRPAPAVVFCQSPYQLVTLPSLLIGLIHSDLWHIISHEFPSRFIEPDWPAEWEECWNTLWGEGGYRYLEGMLLTSRIARQFPGLEAPLVQRSKEELVSWLATGEMRRFEAKLKKELYRRFWGLHLWCGNNFIGERLWHLEHELEADLSEDMALRRQDKLHFAPFRSRASTIYDGVVQSVLSLVNRMGAEPASQVGSAVWLPFGHSATDLASIWRKCVDGDAFDSNSQEVSIWQKLDEQLFSLISIEDVAFVCEKPAVFSIDEAGRFHNAEGPALVFSDGFKVYAWNGVIVDDARIIECPESITIEEIEQAANVELRRVLIDRFGQSRFLTESGAEAIDEDEAGVLYRKDMGDDEPIVMVKVVNRTAEPDGTFREYFLRVPPEITSAREAVAWTFDVETEDYSPLIES